MASNNSNNAGVIHEGLKSLFNRPEFHDPVVDGIRAMAILWVFICHVVFFHFGTYPERVLEIFNSSFTQWIGQGALGVDLFFVISGFLIGTILLKELRNTSRIEMRRFYARRFLRLMPVYIVVRCMEFRKSAWFVSIFPSRARKHDGFELERAGG